MEIRLLCIKQDSKFIQTCRDENLTPRCARLKSGIIGFHGSFLQRSFERQLFNFGIVEMRKRICHIKNDSMSTWEYLTRTLDYDDIMWLNPYVNERINAQTLEIKKRHNKKLDRLRPNIPKVQPYFFNKSKRIFTEEEVALLSKGHDYIVKRRIYETQI
ncbi:hypothetical protein ACOME3_004462 [Neoechinorhynchus agilis]